MDRTAAAAKLRLARQEIEQARDHVRLALAALTPDGGYLAVIADQLEQRLDWTHRTAAQLIRDVERE